MEFGLRETLGQVADHVLALLHLALVRLCQGLDLILMGLAELVDLVLRLFFADH